MFWDRVAWVYDVFANGINRRANRAMCAAVAAHIGPEDEVLECASDEEAIDRAEELKHGGTLYPVHYAVSDTSGEKAFEEFVTEEETADMERFQSLGVITGKTIPDKERVETLFRELTAAFAGPRPTKDGIITIMAAYLPNFEHIETGKGLDSKM